MILFSVCCVVEGRLVLVSFRAAIISFSVMTFVMCALFGPLIHALAKALAFSIQIQCHYGKGPKEETRFTDVKRL